MKIHRWADIKSGVRNPIEVKDLKSMKPNEEWVPTKPVPIGCYPRQTVEIQRCRDLVAALQRYLDTDYEPMMYGIESGSMIKWAAELTDRLKSIKENVEEKS